MTRDPDWILKQDWLTHCFACSSVTSGILDECPVDPSHSVNVIDGQSPDFQAWVLARRAAAAARRN